MNSFLLALLRLAFEPLVLHMSLYPPPLSLGRLFVLRTVPLLPKQVLPKAEGFSLCSFVTLFWNIGHLAL